MAPTPDQQRLLDHLRQFGPGGNDDPAGTVYEDGSVKGGRRAGDSADDYGSSNSAPIEW